MPLVIDDISERPTANGHEGEAKQEPKQTADERRFTQMVWALASVHAHVLQYKFLRDGPFNIMATSKHQAFAVLQR
jgi:hypothetical protein